MLWLSRSQDRTKTSQNQAISNNTLINCSFKSQISSVQHSKFLFNYGIILFETWRSKFNGIDGITQIRWDKLHCDRIPTTSRQLYVLIWLHFIVWCWPLFLHIHVLQSLGFIHFALCAPGNHQNQSTDTRNFVNMR